MTRGLFTTLFGLAMFAAGFGLGDVYGREQAAKALVTRVLTNLHHKKVLSPPDEIASPAPGFLEHYKEHLWQTKKN